MAYFYSEPSLLQPPAVPNLFDERSEIEEETNERVFHEPLYSPSIGLFSTLCSLSELFYEVMVFNSTSVSLDRHVTLLRRAELFRKFKNWCTSLPANLQIRTKFTVHTCYLQ